MERSYHASIARSVPTSRSMDDEWPEDLHAVMARARTEGRDYLMLDRDGEIRRNPIFGDFFLFEIGSGAYRAGPLGGEGVAERNFLSGSEIVTAKWRAKTICRLAATNKCLAATNKRLAKRNSPGRGPKRLRTGAAQERSFCNE